MLQEKQELHAIIKEYQPRIHRYLSRLVGSEYADDLAQEVLLKIAGSFDRFQGRSKTSTWIYRIASNAAVDKIRSASYKQDKKLISADELIMGEIPDIQESGTNSVEQKVIEQEMNSCIRNVIDSLSNSYSTVLILSEFEDFKNREIAEILQISLGAVKIRLSRARSRLRKELQGHCEFYRNEHNQLACEPGKYANHNSGISNSIGIQNDAVMVTQPER